MKILDIPSSGKLGLQVRQNGRYGQIAIKMACDCDDDPTEHTYSRASKPSARCLPPANMALL